MNRSELQKAIKAWDDCCRATNSKLNTTYDNLDEWLDGINECCSAVNATADEIIDLLKSWAADWEASFDNYLCEQVDNTPTTTTSTTTTAPVTTTTTTIDPGQIDFQIIFENFLCQQEDDPTVTTTTTIPLKSGTISFESSFSDYLCEQVDNPAITTTTTTSTGTTTSTTTVAPGDIAFSASYDDYLCEQVNNPLLTTTTTTTTINEDDVSWEIAFENFLCQQTESTTTTAAVTTTTTTISENCGDNISGEKVFPSIHHINLGSSIGLVELSIEAIDAPDKFIVEWGGAEVINTGYRGDSSFQNELYAALAAEGATPEAVSGAGSGTFSFNKTSTDPIATVKVYAPIDETKWSFILSCPVTTTTSDPEETIWEASYDNYLCEQEDNPAITTTTTTSAPTTTTTTAPVTTSTTTIAVNEISCGDAASGEEAYPMEIYVVDMGSGTGYMNLNFDSGEIPDKYIIEIDGLEVVNTGYRGNSDLQSVLNDALASRGLPPETIQGTGQGTVKFFKSSSTSVAIVKVYAPVAETDWEFTLTCPDGSTTTTTIPSTTTTTTTTPVVTTTTTTSAPPVSTNNSEENERPTCGASVILTPSMFTFTDAEGDDLDKVKITSYSIAGAGSLTYNGVAVTNNQILTVIGGATGSFIYQLLYTPDSATQTEFSDTIEFLVKTDNSDIYG